MIVCLFGFYRPKARSGQRAPNTQDVIRTGPTRAMEAPLSKQPEPVIPVRGICGWSVKVWQSFGS